MGRDDEIRPVPRIEDGKADLNDLWNLLDERLVHDARALAAIHAPPMPDSLINTVVAAMGEQPGLSALDGYALITSEFAAAHADALMARLAETEAER